MYVTPKNFENAKFTISASPSKFTKLLKTFECCFKICSENIYFKLKTYK